MAAAATTAAAETVSDRPVIWERMHVVRIDAEMTLVRVRIAETLDLISKKIANAIIRSVDRQIGIMYGTGSALKRARS